MTDYTQFLDTWRQHYTPDEWENHITYIADILTGDVDGITIDDHQLSLKEFTDVYNHLHGR